MIAIVLLGPPGAGKGTLAESLRDKTDYIHVSTGDMLREAIEAETPLGLEIKASMARGELAPDSVILDIIKERIARDDADTKFMFDGFPRTLEQAESLDKLLNHIGGELKHVINMIVPEELLVERLTGRRTCKSCGSVYHITNVPPHTAGHCDRDDCDLYQRPDDNEETVRNRIAIYEDRTAPLIQFYRDKGLIRDINATATPDQTCSFALDALNG